MFRDRLRADTVTINGRVRTGKSGPEKVIQIPGGTGAVICQYDQWKTVDTLFRVDRGAERLCCGIGIAPSGTVGRTFNNQYTG